MAISRVPGFSLLPNLDRQGIDLEFSTQGNTLVYMDFAGFKFGINTTAPQESLEVNGNLLVSNGSILSSGNLSYTLGNSANWWSNIYANTIIGTLTTPNQPFITNLGNITVTDISIGGNISITGNINGGAIYADELYEANYRVLSTNTIVTLNGDVTGSGNNSNIYVSLIASGVAAGTYGSNLLISQITFDSAGRAVSAGNVTLEKVGNISVVGNTITSIVGDILLSSNIQDINVSNTIAVNHLNSNAITASSAQILGAEVLTANSNINITGVDLTGYGTNSNVYVGLTTTGVSQGTYGSSNTIPQIVIDSKGRVTYAANLAITTTIGNLTVVDTTISSNANITISAAGNIILDAQGTGIVILQGTDAVQLPTGDSSTRPLYPVVGYSRFNTDVGSIEYYDGSDWIIPGYSSVTSEIISPDGSANTFTLSSNATTYGVFVSINGTVQQPVTAYNVHSNNQISFTEIPQVTDSIEVRHFGAGITVSGLAYGNTKIQTTGTKIEVTGNLEPIVSNVYNLGSSSYWWNDLYLSGNTIYLGGMAITNNNGILTTTIGGNLTTLQADDPVSSHDVVTLGYLQSQLSSISTNSITADDTTIEIIDDGISAGNVLISVDGTNIAKVGSNQVDLYTTANISGNLNIGGNISIFSQTISIDSEYGFVGVGYDGIGTTKLYVSSDDPNVKALMAYSTHDNGEGVITSWFDDSYNYSNNGNVSFGGLMLASSNGGDFHIVKKLVGQPVGHKEYLQLRNGAMAEHFTMDWYGNIGLGNTAPQHKLVVSGTANITGNLSAGNINMADNVISNPQLQSYSEAITIGGNVSGNVNVDLSLTNVFNYTLTGNVNFTFINPPAVNVSKPATLIIAQDSTGNRTATFANAKWTDSLTPTLTTLPNKYDVFTFFTIDGGASYFATYAMANVSVT